MPAFGRTLKLHFVSYRAVSSKHTRFCFVVFSLRFTDRVSASGQGTAIGRVRPFVSTLAFEPSGLTP